MHWIALRPAPDPSGQSAVLADDHTALAWWALQFTPLVAQFEDALVLEVSGSERLFGGRAALVNRITHDPKPLEAVELAEGSTALVALGRLWSLAPLCPPDDLPLHALAAARAHLVVLQRLGCLTWGQLRSLPRGGLVRRFGAGLVDALDRAYGQQPEVYPWLSVPEVFDAPLELAASVETATAMVFGARRLLRQLQVWLRLRQRGVLALELLWQLDSRRSNALHTDAHHQGGAWGHLQLRTAQPTQDMQHLQRLMVEQLARVHLPAPVLMLRLRSVQTQVLAGESLSLLPEDLRAGDPVQQLLERLSARLGPQQVLRPALRADFRAEHMQAWSPALDLPQLVVRAVSEVAPGWALYPTWLLATPQALEQRAGCPQYHGNLELLAGPQRLESGWLEGDGDSALRDYFVARSQTAGLVWIFRDRLANGLTNKPARWYLHGLFA